MKKTLVQIGAFLTLSLALGAAGVELGFFQGASPAIAIPYDSLELPPVVEGAANNPASLIAVGFVPTFEELTNGETIIDSEKEWKQVWRRLFGGTPYNTVGVSFNTHFVVLMGAGLTSSSVSFGISSVEQFEATFKSPDWFFGDSVVPKLAITSTTVFPGVQQDPEVKPPPYYHLSAVAIPIEFKADILSTADSWRCRKERRRQFREGAVGAADFGVTEMVPGAATGLSPRQTLMRFSRIVI